MIIILNISSEKFSLNGIPYFKNFMPHVLAGKLKIVNVYDTKFQLTELDSSLNYSVDGVTYTSVTELQNALLPVLYTRNSLNFDSDLPFYNQITKETGFTSSGLNKTFNAGWKWLINNVEYTNSAPVTITFPLASAGKQRLDRIVVTNINTFIRIQGVESISSPTADPRPDNTVDVTFVLVTDTEVGEPTPPVIGPEDLALKLDKGNYIGTAQTLKDDIDNIYQPDVLISSVPPTRSVNTFTYPASQYVALISKTIRTNPAQFITTISVAATDYKRVDLIYFKSDNTIAKLIGTESLTVAPRPDVPANCVAISFINVFGNVISDPTPVTQEISFQDYFGTEKFKVSDYVRFKGVTLESSTKSVIVDPLVGGVIFISSTLGDNVTALLENRNKPFSTIDAAITAIPNDGKNWTLWVLNGTQTISTVLPDRNLIFYSNESVILNINASYALNNNTVRYVFDFPYGTINFNTSFVTKQSATISINCNVLNQATNIQIRRVTSLDIKVITLNLNGGTFIDQETAGLSPILTFNIRTLTSNGTCTLVSGGNTDTQIINLNIIKITATGSLTLSGARGLLTATIGDYSATVLGNMFLLPNAAAKYNLNFNNSIINNGSITGSSVTSNLILTGILYYTGTYLFGNFSNFTLYNLNLVLNTSYLCNRLQGNSFEMYSSYITTSLQITANESLSSVYTKPLLKVYGESSIIKTGGGVFFNIHSGTTNAYVEEVGTLKVNTPYFGIGVGRVVSALSFKEKEKEIIIRSKFDLMNRVLDSNTTYIIDGAIVLLTGEYIQVPVGGLTITGYGFNASSISKNIAGQSIFISPAGNSGDLVTRDLSYYPGLGMVFNITDSSGFHAIELNDVNFQGVTGSSLGIINGYRQFTGTTCGIYSLSDGLTLEGNWAGFKLTNSNIIGFGATGTLFKKGVSTLFSNRFYIDINLQIATESKICDFADANFSNNKSLQVVNCYTKVNGFIDDTTTGTTFPNITPYSSKAYFVNNIGIKNSNNMPYGISTGNMQTYPNDTAAAAGGIVAIGDTYIESSTGYFKKRQT